MIFYNTTGEVYVGDANINCARIVSAIIMHLALFPEIRVCIDMLQYITYKSHTFYEKCALFPFIILLGKFAGAFMMEGLTVYVLIRKKTVVTIINAYIANFLIGRIGSVMANTLSNFDISKEMGENTIMFDKHTIF